MSVLHTIAFAGGLTAAAATALVVASVPVLAVLDWRHHRHTATEAAEQAHYDQQFATLTTHLEETDQ